MSYVRWLQSYSGVRARIGDTMTDEDEVFAFRHAYCYALSRLQANPRVRGRVVLAHDPRPTSVGLAHAQADGIFSAFRDLGVQLDLVYLGVVSTPVWQHAVRLYEGLGGVMVTASHNPIEDNGWKYATGVETHSLDPAPPGALLSASEMGMLIRAANTFHPNPLLQRIDLRVDEVRREEAISHYIRFAVEHYGADLAGVRVVLDPNGGAACGIAGRLFQALGVEPIVLNDVPGNVAHAIDVEVRQPDGSHVLESLAERVREEGAEFGLAYDFDADRGSLTYVDADGRPAIPSPQMAAAINTAIALALHRRSGDPRPAAVVASDATSYRVHEIAARFGAEVVEVETGEINVVTRMRDLEAEGKRAVVGVEGPNGGTIFAGTTCRDGSLVGAGALLAACDTDLRRIAHEALDPNHELAPRLPGFIALLPKWRTEARKAQADPDMEWADLIDQWERQLPELMASSIREDWTRHEFHYSYTRYVGPERPAKGKGYGWKVRLHGPQGHGFLWIRGSKTEAGVVRIVADAPDAEAARRLLDVGTALLGPT